MPVAPVAAAKVGVRERVRSLDELRKVLEGFRGRNVSPTARAIVVGMIAMGGARGSEIMRARRA